MFPALPESFPVPLHIYSLSPSCPKCIEKPQIGEFPSLEYMNPNSVVFRFIGNGKAALGGCGGGGGEEEVMWQHGEIKSDSYCEENGA